MILYQDDFGGVLINPLGEVIALTTKLVRKSMQYEIYAKVQAYLPWIKLMVKLHGS